MSDGLCEGSHAEMGSPSSACLFLVTYDQYIKVVAASSIHSSRLFRL